MSENVKIENKKTGGKDLTAEIKNLVVEFRTDWTLRSGEERPWAW